MARPSWIGTTLGGRYKIEALLGQGGMSAVYKANDPNLRRPVAIKLIHSHLSDNPEFVRRFEEEAAAVARLRHPHIVQVYDFNHDDDVYYMVLEFVPGKTLEDELRDLNKAGQRMPLETLMAINRDLYAAVNYAHNQDLIHRDLKPANLMITPKGDPILMDFGIVKIIGGDVHTATGAMMGTASYMAPEQIMGGKPDRRTDIYALGIMLYEMVSGQKPYQGDSAPATMMMHINNPIPDVRQINKMTPPALAAIIQKAMAKEPDARFQSAAEMAAALADIDLAATTTAYASLPIPTPAGQQDDGSPAIMPGDTSGTQLDPHQIKEVTTDVPDSGTALASSAASLSAPTAPPRRPLLLSLRKNRSWRHPPQRQQPHLTPS